MDASPDGTRLLAARNLQATVCDARTGVVQWQSPLGTDGSSTAIFAADGRSVFTAGMSIDPFLRRWSLPDGALLAELAVANCRGGDAFAVSPDGAFVAIAPSDTWIHVFDAELVSERLRRLLPESVHPELAVAPGARALLAASRADGLRLWTVGGPAVRAVLAGHTSYVYSLAFSPDGRRLASGSWDRSVRLWEVDTQQPIATFAGLFDLTIEALAWSADGLRLFASTGRQVVALDAETGREIGRGEIGALVQALSMRPSSSELLVTTSEGVLLLDAATLRVRRDVAGARSAAFSPDGRRLATHEPGHAVVIHEAGSLAEMVRGRDALAGGGMLAWSPDGRRVAWVGDGALSILDARDGRTRVKAALVGKAMDFAWSPDGNRLVLGRTDGGVEFVDAASGKRVVSLSGHRAYVKAVAFSPDGTTLASASGDGDVRLWLARP